ncbi:MAG: hypothetical protein SNJ67_01730 [Chloracidobacterium sp.]
MLRHQIVTPFSNRSTWGRRLSYGGLLLLVVVGALVSAADRRAAANDGLALARVLPKGALAYVQARDFSDLLARWRNSQVRERYEVSDSYRAFRRSRLWAKLNERIKEFETNVGVTLTEDVVAQMAGKGAAIALYDMGKLELAFVTELSATQATATPLLARKALFENRTTATGQSYLVRELATDGGRLRQGLCVATPPGQFIVTTNEALMQRALDNLGGNRGDDLLSTMGPTLSIADGFVPHDLTLWTDVPRLRKQPYFGYYWVQGAAATELNGIEATLADVTFAQDGIEERRWSLTTGRAVPAALTSQQQSVARQLLNAAPFAAVETVKKADDAVERIAALVVGVVFPPLRTPTATEPPRIRVIDDTTDATASRGRYQRLDARFDRDLDDPNAPSSLPTARQTLSRQTAQPPDPLEVELVNLLRSAQPIYIAKLGETNTAPGSPFVTFERALVIHCERSFDTKAYEAAVARAIARRYFVAGTVPQITWQVGPTGVAAAQAAAPLERGSAYFVSNDLVVIASSQAYAEQLKARLAASSPAGAGALPAPYRQAIVRLPDLSPGYQQAMRMIGFRGASPLMPLEEEPMDESVAFFGQNVSSLLTVTEEFNTLTVESAATDGRLVERIHYGRRTMSPRTGE